MQQHRIPAADPDIEAWHRLIDAVAAEIAAGAPQDPESLVARIAARLAASGESGFHAYLPMMFTDPEK